MGIITDPQPRQAPSGRHIDLEYITVNGGGPFALRHRRAAADAVYNAPLLSAVTAIEADPVVPGTSALIVMPLPLVTPPAGYKWSLQALFSGSVLLVCPEEVNVRLDLQHQYQDLNDDWQPLSPSGSGVCTQFVESPTGGAQIDKEESVSMLALRDQDDFNVETAATEVNVRVAWGLLVGSGGGSAQFRCANSAISNLTLEDQRNGWDYSVGWVLRPSTDIS